MNIFRSKAFYGCFFICVAVVGFIIYLYYTDEGVATELRQIRQPMPNLFSVAIDVSATIDEDTLANLKEALTERLRNFVGENTVSYHISTFGNPGCGKTAVRNIVSAQSPGDEVTFKWEVEKKIDKDITTPPKGSKSLTTPLYYLLETILPERMGGRIIIFSDLMNNDGDCIRQYPFPEKAILKFGQNKEGQLVFLYTTPTLTNTPALNERILERQRDFIEKMENLRAQGKIRVFFYHIPDDSKKRTEFIISQLQNAIPTTMFEVVWERASKMVDTIVSAVRG